MPYIRHRDRMVQESVFEDLKNTLIACRWTTGTTTRPVRSPATPVTFDPITGQYFYPPKTIMTTGIMDVMPLLKKRPVVLIDYFPETEGSKGRDEKTAANTFAMDSGQAGDPVEAELGSPALEQEYVFNFAFYAASDAVALAVLNDLRDRYQGKIVSHMGIDLYNFNEDADVVVGGLDIETFRYVRPDEQVTPYEIHLYFAELVITDYV